MAEIELSADGTEHAEVAFDLVMDAIAAASDQDRCTWVLVDGKRVAYIGTVDVGEAAEQAMHDLLRTPLQGEWRDVGPTEDARAVTLVIGEQLARDLGYTGSWPRGVLDPPSSRDPEGQG